MKEKTMIMFEGVSKEQITVINDVINIMKKNIEKCKGEHMLRKGSLTGLLLFGIFFGAGNLIFPPTLGAQSGSHFGPAIGGFVLSHETWNKRHITLIEN